MTRDEQRVKLAERMFAAFEDSSSGPTAIDWMLAALDAIGAAGGCVVMPNNEPYGDELIDMNEFFALIRAGNLANAPEAVEKE